MKKKQVIIFILHMLALGVPTVYFVLSAEAVFGEEFSFAFILVIYALVGAAFLMSIILHEIGHLVAGFLSGYRFLMIRLLRFALSSEEGGLRFRRFGFPGSLGQCLMVPKGKEDRSFLPYFMGGGILNLITGLLGLWAVFVMPYRIGPILYLLFGFHGVFAIGLGATNLIPMKVEGIPNDGCFVRLLLEDKRRVEAFHETQHLTWQLFRGVRPRDMEMGGLARYDELEASDMFRIIAVSFDVLRLADSGEPEEAMERIAAIRGGLEDAPEVYRLDIMQSEFFFEVYYRRDRERAKALFPVLEQHLRLKRSTDAYLALGAYHLCIEEDRETALGFLAKAREAARTSPLRGAAEMDMGYIESLLAEADALEGPDLAE